MKIGLIKEIPKENLIGKTWKLVLFSGWQSEQCNRNTYEIIKKGMIGENMNRYNPRPINRFKENPITRQDYINDRMNKIQATWRYDSDGYPKIRIEFPKKFDRFVVLRIQSMVGILFEKVIYKKWKRVIYIHVGFYGKINDNSDIDVEEYDSDENESENENDMECSDDCIKSHSNHNNNNNLKRVKNDKLTTTIKPLGWKEFLKQNNIELTKVKKVTSNKWDELDIFVDEEEELDEDMATDQSEEGEEFDEYGSEDD